MFWLCRPSSGIEIHDCITQNESGNWNQTPRSIGVWEDMWWHWGGEGKNPKWLCVSFSVFYFGSKVIYFNAWLWSALPKHAASMMKLIQFVVVDSSMYVNIDVIYRSGMNYTKTYLKLHCLRSIIWKNSFLFKRTIFVYHCRCNWSIDVNWSLCSRTQHPNPSGPWSTLADHWFGQWWILKLLVGDWRWCDGHCFRRYHGSSC